MWREWVTSTRQAGGIYCGIAAFFVFGVSATAAQAADTIIINEIMWDGTEYVELYNPTAAAVNISSWQLARQQLGGEVQNIVTFPEDTLVAAADYYLIEKTEVATLASADLVAAHLTLVNTGEQVTLRNEQGDILDTANQLGAWFAGSNTAEGVAMERGNTGNGTLADHWHTATDTLHGRVGTPDAANSVPPLNTAPVAAISGATQIGVGETVTLSAEDSTDADQDTLTYAWSFSDTATATGVEVRHTFVTVGTHLVRLTVSDGEAESEATHAVLVNQPSYSDQLVINEYVPNPMGSDTAAEFIELKNIGAETVSLEQWQLDDADGGSAPYSIPAGVTLSPGSVRAFMRSETKIALNNSADTVRLLDPSGVVKALTTYTSSAEGQSYNRTDDTTFAASTTLTPGQANTITAPVTEDESIEDDSSDGEATTSGRVAGTSAVTLPLADIREEAIGTTIKTEGVVSAPPGVLGKQLMYLAGSGVQIYFSQAEWPDVKLGDRVTVTGTLSSNRGETRLKLAGKANIAKVGAGDPPLPHRTATGEIGEAWEGSLVIIQGQVTETNGDTFYVDDGSGEVRVVIGESTKIDKPKMSRGTDVTITGIVSETTSGYRILPRFQEDVRLGLVAGLTSFPATGALTIVALPGVLSVVLLSLGYRASEPLLRLSQ